MANKENIRKWVEALRSGKYQQITGKLSDGIGYCCLGVACEVAIESGVGVARKLRLDDKQPSILYGQGEDCGELPDEVGYWLGLTYQNEYGDFRPISDPVLVYKSAIELNDGGTDFKSIADLIEAEFLEETVS